jgi:cyclic beta-1,2-glucan synthetase
LLALLNPVNHGDTPSKIANYRVEPYVVAADVYGTPPHLGRGGWTWYTGSAGWMYRLVTETLLGLNREGNQLRMQPRIPAGWPGFKIQYRFHETVYQIVVHRNFGAAQQHAVQIVADGQALKGDAIPLVDDHQAHHIEVAIGGQLIRGSDEPSREPAALAIPPELGVENRRRSRAEFYPEEPNLPNILR